MDRPMDRPVYRVAAWAPGTPCSWLCGHAPAALVRHLVRYVERCALSRRGRVPLMTHHCCGRLGGQCSRSSLHGPQRQEWQPPLARPS